MFLHACQHPVRMEKAELRSKQVHTVHAPSISCAHSLQCKLGSLLTVCRWLSLLMLLQQSQLYPDE